MHLTTNYIVEQLPWPGNVQSRLAQFNGLLMAFRQKVEPARSKRIAHTDLHHQIERSEAMRTFNKGEDAQFFADLQSFYDVAYRHIFDATPQSIAAGIPPDAHKISRAIAKATLYNRCKVKRRQRRGCAAYSNLD